jgi:precorrin-3B C17-methyltransferase
MTPRALQAIEASDVIVGYKMYVNLLGPLADGKEVLSTGMTKEADRCGEAIRLAESGKRVTLISSGDAGVYGMAGLALEMLADRYPDGPPFGFEVVPGIPSAFSSAATLGAPLMHDFAVISLSDLLTPIDLIMKRIDAAASADFVIAFYNPRSKGRPGHLESARRVILKHRPPETPVGIVKDSTREEESAVVTTLGSMDVEIVDMTTMVIVGNSSSFAYGEWMVTPRGYKGKRF